MENGAADAAVGHSSPVPSEARPPQPPRRR